MIVRADSAFYGHDIIAAARRVGARFSVTARHTPAVTRAITGIGEHAWTPIHYPNAIFDEDEQRWISDAEVAEVAFTAFTGRRKVEHVTARLIVRRVRRLNPAHVPAGQAQIPAARWAIAATRSTRDRSTEQLRQRLGGASLRQQLPDVQIENDRADP